MALIKCPGCKKEISEEATDCPNCGYSLAGEKILKTRRFIWIFVALGFGFLVVFALLEERNSKTQVHETRQHELRYTLSKFRTSYRAATSNDLLQNTITDDRNKFLCSFIGGEPQVQDWTGRIKSIRQGLSTLGYGLVVSIDEAMTFLTLETYGGAPGERDMENLGSPSNIQPGSPLAGALAGLKPGDHITFSGEFIIDKNGCAIERSVNTRGSFDRPQLLFRFTSINGVSGNEPPRG